MNKQVYKLFIVVALSGFLASCIKNPKSTGRDYMPDMKYSQAYETYTPNPNFKDDRTDRVPVAGTITREELKHSNDESWHKSYLFKRYYDNTPDGYELAGKELKNPVKLSDKVLAEGKTVFETYCIVCHDAKGTGKGSIVESGAFPPVPVYSTILKDKPMGKMFFSITYGRNLMGSYSSQVSVEDRWKVIYYIQKLAGVNQFAATQTESGAQAADTTAAN